MRMSAALPIPTEALAAIAAAGAVMAVLSIQRLVAVVRSSILVRVPAVAEQDVTLAEAGTVVLCIEAPQFGMQFAGVDFAMRDSNGRDVPSSPIVFRAKVSGFSRVRLSVRAFAIPRAGRYRLLASGIAPGRDMSAAALLLARPFAGAMVLWILGITFGGVALIGGSVLASLRLAGKL
ncbi:MAG TPA: hypothetical protein VKB52_12275 [Rhodanobacteraceae bacterium]|nr:hypothetical protein [Rhodanobacteraceae bacterium]